jgi:PAS domain S-box-containing protein
LSDSDNKPDAGADKSGGRSFGKYRLINDDELPRLTTQQSGEQEGPAETDDEVDVEERRDSASPAGRSDRGTIPGGRARPDGADGRSRRTRSLRADLAERGMRADRRLRADLSDPGTRYNRAARGESADLDAPAGTREESARSDLDGRGVRSRRSDQPTASDRRAREAPAVRGARADRAARTGRAMRAGPVGPGAQAQNRERPDRRERPERPKRGGASGPEAAGPVEESRERASARKGSCPSWLKSRVQKDKRSSESDRNLLELQELIIRHSPVGTAVLDNTGRIRIRNGSFLEILALEDDPQLGDIEAIAETVDCLDLTERFWDAVEMGTSAEADEEIAAADGGLFRVHAVFVPVNLPSGVNWCICYLDNAYDEPAHAQAPAGRMYEYQNYVARLATSSADAIIGLDADGTVKYWNQGAEALFGFTEDEIVGKSALPLIPDELRREAQLVLKVVRQKGVYRNFDTQRLNKSGERIPVTMTISSVRDEDGNFVGTAATCRDLRDAKDLRDKALEAEKLTAVLQIAISVYHQINDPLCVIAANAQLLLSQLNGEDKERTKRLESIVDSAKRISGVLDNLSELTGVEPQAVPPEDESSAA